MRPALAIDIPTTTNAFVVATVLVADLVADDAVRRARSRHSDGDRSAKMSFADRLAPLDESTKSLLRSGVVTPSLPIALVELVQNALDAQATRIDVEVDPDPASPTIRVSDDGRGLSRDMLTSVGRFRYLLQSSESPGSLHYGYRGEALASLAQLSLLDICSRTVTSTQSHQVVLRNGQLLSSSPGRYPITATSGTVVTVQDLFHNLPVRRATSDPHRAQKDLEECRKRLQMAAIVNPQVDFTLVERRGRLLRSSSSTSTDRDRRTILRIAKTGSSVATFTNLVAEHPVEVFRKVSVHTAEATLEAWFCTQPTSSRSGQLICVDRRAEIVTTDLHRIVQRALSKSPAFHMSDPSPSPSPSPGLGLRSSTKRKARSDSYPSYLLLFRSAPTLHHPGTRPGVAVLGDAVLESMATKAVQEFIKQSPSPANEIKARTTSCPDVQTLLHRPTVKIRPGRSACPAPSPSIFRAAKPVRAGLGRVDRSALREASASAAAQPTWLDEAVSRNATRATFGVTAGGLGTAPALNQFGTTDRTTDCCRGLSLREVRRHFARDQSQTDVQLADVLSRAALEGAEFIAQVDHKFLLCRLRVSSSADPILALLDQHAADERCRVEAIFQELFSTAASIVKLASAALVLVPSSDLAHADAALHRLATYGFQVQLADVSGMQAGDRWTQVAVATVPAILADRLANDSALLQDAVRSCVTSSDCAPRLLSKVEAMPSRRPSWLASLKSCPSKLVELVNSKACRSAIMFGDELSGDECRMLLQRLAATCFPFHCAHGRPSLVTLAQPRCDVGPSPLSQLDWTSLARVASGHGQ